MHRGPADAVLPGDLADAPSVLMVSEDTVAIEIERWSSDVPAFQTRSSHAAADALDDQRPFQLRDGTDDDGDGAAQRAARIKVLAERYELDSEPAQLVQDLKQMPG